MTHRRDRIAGYDPERDETHRWVTEEPYCRKMARKYGWKYKGYRIDPQAKILKVRCTYKGEAEIPPDYMENDDD